MRAWNHGYAQVKGCKQEMDGCDRGGGGGSTYISLQVRAPPAYLADNGNIPAR